MDRLGLGILIIVVVSASLSCFEARPSNPLDATVSLLLIPTVLEPSGGEQLFPGTLLDIRWSQAAGGIDDTVTLQLISDTDTDTLVIDAGVTNSGSRSWSVPDRPGLAYRIRIIGKGGASESANVFRIKQTPVTHKLGIGSRDGRFPAALEQFVVFESGAVSRPNLWVLDRINQTVSQLTHKAFGAYGASWYKPRGKIFAYTAVNDLNTASDIWVHVIEGFFEGDYQITLDGGLRPTWQISDAFENLSLAYVKLTPLPGSGELKQIMAVTLDTPSLALPTIRAPLGILGSPALIAQTYDYALNYQSLAWAYTNDRNELVYITHSGQNRVSRLIFPAGNFTDISVGPFALSLELSPDKITFSPNGRYMTFGSNGHIWVSAVNGLDATPVTDGSTTDSFPDWASDTEIIFQRQGVNRTWELWSVSLGDPP